MESSAPAAAPLTFTAAYHPTSAKRHGVTAPLGSVRRRASTRPRAVGDLRWGVLALRLADRRREMGGLVIAFHSL